MKKIIIVTLLFFAFGFCGTASVAVAQSAPFAAKLPYAKGQSFVVTTGFHTPPTHIKKDDFAIDFTQDGCDAYAKPAVAAVSGKAWIVDESGYNGGYGTQLLLLSKGNVVTRYAHMMPNSVTVAAGDEVLQGTPIGEIGDTGLVAGNACALHPGTHIHFAMDADNADGSFTAIDPEPISGYSDIEVGNWYLSDNAPPADAETKMTGTAIAAATIGGVADDGDADKQSLEASGTITASSIVGEAQNPVLASATQDASPPTHVPDDFPSSSASGLPVVPITEQSQAQSPPPFSSGGGSGSGGISVAPMPSSMGGVTATPAPTASGSQPSQNTSSAAASSSLAETDPLLNAPTSSSPTSTDMTDVEINPNGGGTPTASSSPLILSTSASASANSSTIAVADADVSSSSSHAAASSSSSSFSLGVPTFPAGSQSFASFNSSALAIDFAWQPPVGNVNASSNPITYSIFAAPANASNPTFIASTTGDSFSYPVADADFGNAASFAIQAIDGMGDQSALVTTTVGVPAWFSPIQPADNDESRPSWYSDNWYDLGTGFTGTLRSLTFEGYVNSDDYRNSTLDLQEFSDSGYSLLDHTFPISVTPITNVPQKLVEGDLVIPLSPEKYYRLATVEELQNASVVLRGTDATGTAMWDNFVYGIGKIEYPYSFYPYLTAVIDPEETVIAPPILSGDITVGFEPVGSTINVSWPAATDPDEPLVSPTYQVNVSTSTTLDPAAWQSEGTKPPATFGVTFPNSYTIGVRALDDFGNPSAPITSSWSFPADYVPPPAQLDHSTSLGDQGVSQEITFTASTTVKAIDFWTAPEAGIYCCSQTILSVRKDNAGSPGDQLPSGNPSVTYGFLVTAGGEKTYAFSSPMLFLPGNYWFTLAQPDLTSPTIIYGSPGGMAYFRMQQ